MFKLTEKRPFPTDAGGQANISWHVDHEPARSNHRGLHGTCALHARRGRVVCMRTPLATSALDVPVRVSGCACAQGQLAVQGLPAPLSCSHGPSAMAADDEVPEGLRGWAVEVMWINNDWGLAGVWGLE